MEVLARSALMLLYCGGKPSLAFFLFGAGSLGGGSKLLADVPAPFPFVWPIFVQLSKLDPFPVPAPVPAPAPVPDPRTDPEPGPSPEPDPVPDRRIRFKIKDPVPDRCREDGYIRSNPAQRIWQVEHLVIKLASHTRTSIYPRHLLGCVVQSLKFKKLIYQMHRHQDVDVNGTSENKRLTKYE